MKNISCKKFIRLSTGAVAATALSSIWGCNTKPAPTTPIGLQLYSVRHELDDDFEG